MGVRRVIVLGKEGFKWGKDGNVFYGDDAIEKATAEGNPKPEKVKNDKHDRD